ncbi:MAG: phosphoserine transaminase [Candidatus Muproteobacteria bacterium RIFCSPHIGHO2_12_FULL_60_33]|uniref:Phosphoserine aminotransferase n=1 Tax=Candidatus Muproteobacteria bacterium RIFCSPLOWO2_01_FULL_60_18 TaxID=1817768 RepID=A0A1F6TZ02_9PROT|nr:MAG: phosphoserine transaminase [Candidatus Muproteobacteria bacterium RIFCSPHIGHO2_01_60_12]OGI50302.1 MAG: phosphoserine transaminase [Candidatus Muproteobacteria bacterium RIFCSPLOWO2_01_FULL_60_18]OGI53983.1 MAG: phosphoserine transaminase [Candidatus Muproteobacteria bacterium RIFCSPHIGHO2_12_FULL_60_33]OGI54153.1 MAG: phosphoserine transaminase [Candidatus Muproteobacteria bacterium RIFCSPHIGHO2_02_FULL_60_13]OGI59236.1 MAG: phosphoserine transaminase [Candidatus Muproteobacteria bacte
MARVFNFSAGPAVLPEEVLQQAKEELLDWHGSGMSVMEMSHRGKEFIAIAEKAEADLRELMNIPANYKVLFLQGGAAAQFAMVPLNLLRGKKSADYINTGEWSKKAIKEARKFGGVNIAATSEATNFSTVPPQKDWKLDPDAAYLHYTPNETIGGVEFSFVPQTGGVPLVADMSSTILSRPVDVTRFGVIYAGAQKNIGPAGLTIVIVREDLIGGAAANTPSMFDYKIHVENASMYNTPPTYGWYIAGLVFDWLKKKGGLKAMAEINQRKAEKLYACIDSSGGFYKNPVEKHSRSWMNVPFTLKDAALDEPFLKGTKAAGLVQLKGHRSVGGMRASIYNAMPEAGIDALIAYMQDFMRKNG